MSLAGAVVSLLRGGQFYYDAPEDITAETAIQGAGQPDPAAAAI
jgi:hypothetical protein